MKSFLTGIIGVIVLVVFKRYVVVKAKTLSDFMFQTCMTLSNVTIIMLEAYSTCIGWQYRGQRGFPLLLISYQGVGVGCS